MSTTKHQASPMYWTDTVYWTWERLGRVHSDYCLKKHKTQGGAYLCGAARLRNKAAISRGARADQVVPYASLGMDVYQR